MENTYYISSYCRIKNNQVVVNDQVILNDEDSDSPSVFFKKIYTFLNTDYPKFYKMDLLCKGGFLAAELITKEHSIQQENVALIFSNQSSSYVSDKKHADGIFDQENPVASPAVFVYTLPNILMGELSIRHQLHSENIFYIFDRFNPEFLTFHNQQFLNQGKADKILSGWIEVKEDDCDIFLYLVEKEGKYPHTQEVIEKLYTQII